MMIRNIVDDVLYNELGLDNAEVTTKITELVTNFQDSQEADARRDIIVGVSDYTSPKHAEVITTTILDRLA